MPPQQHQVDREIKAIILEIEQSFELLKNAKNKPEGIPQARFDNGIQQIKDMQSSLIKELSEVAEIARKSGLLLPVEFSYFMTDYMTSKFNKTLEYDFIDQAVAYDYAVNNGYECITDCKYDQNCPCSLFRQKLKLSFEIDEIKKGFKEGHKEAPTRRNSTDDTLFKFLEGREVIKLTPNEFGLLLGKSTHKLTIGKVKEYYAKSLHKSAPEINRLFIEKGVKANMLKDVPPKTERTPFTILPNE